MVAAGALTRIPPGVSCAHAAAFGVAHRTAYHVLRSFASVQPGEELVVLGAGGGVGLAAVQLGATLGRDGDGRRLVRREAGAAAADGAARLIDHRAGDLRQALKDAARRRRRGRRSRSAARLSEPALRCLR